MLPIEEIFAIGRVIERLLICAIAGVSLTYGWNLFRVGVLNEQSAEFAAKGWRINLKRVGPGAFFALFGSVVLSISLRSPLVLPLTAGSQHSAEANQSNSAGSSSGERQPEVVYLQGQDSAVAKKWVADLNTILHVATPDKFQGATEQKVIKRTEEDLETLRNAIVIRQFGALLFREYNAYRQRVLNEGAGTQEEQKKFEQIDEWMQANRIQE
jgi:hypothetical protein